jgi:nitrogen regulatory protein PII
MITSGHSHFSAFQKRAKSLGIIDEDDDEDEVDSDDTVYYYDFAVYEKISELLKNKEKELTALKTTGNAVHTRVDVYMLGLTLLETLLLRLKYLRTKPFYLAQDIEINDDEFLKKYLSLIDNMTTMDYTKRPAATVVNQKYNELVNHYPEHTDYVIAIPSYGNQGVLGSTTLAVLDEHKINKDKVYIFVNHADVDTYANALPKEYSTKIIGMQDISKTSISEYFRINTPIVVMDDDIVSLSDTDSTLDTFLSTAFKNHLKLYGTKALKRKTKNATDCF